MIRSCLLITLIKCLKGHKSLGSLCNVLKTLIVSGAGQTNRPTDQGTLSPIELFWTAKKLKKKVGKKSWKKKLEKKVGKKVGEKKLEKKVEKKWKKKLEKKVGKKNEKKLKKSW